MSMRLAGDSTDLDHDGRGRCRFIPEALVPIVSIAGGALRHVHGGDPTLVLAVLERATGQGGGGQESDEHRIQHGCYGLQVACLSGPRFSHGVSAPVAFAQCETSRKRSSAIAGSSQDARQILMAWAMQCIPSEHCSMERSE
jgi:hypothetical protein